MKYSEIKEKYCVERTCYDDYFDVREIKTGHLIMSGSSKEVKQLIACWLNE
jgi:hypothetical protein